MIFFNKKADRSHNCSATQPVTAHSDANQTRGQNTTTAANTDSEPHRTTASNSDTGTDTDTDSNTDTECHSNNSYNAESSPISACLNVNQFCSIIFFNKKADRSHNCSATQPFTAHSDANQTRGQNTTTAANTDSEPHRTTASNSDTGTDTDTDSNTDTEYSYIAESSLISACLRVNKF